MITHSSMLNTGTHNWTTAVPKASLVARNKSLTWLSMVLGAILSLNHQLLNVTAYDTSALFAHNLTSNESEPNNQLNVQSKEYVPVFELVLGTITYLIIIIMTLVGNTMVVVAVFSYRPLKKVQNYFLVSLAASDLAVSLIVMPLHVVKFLANGRWLLGVTVCQLFTTADILLCTSSILNLCAIALDRYWAIHDPINYAQKRTPQFVCMIIILVWIASGLISVPPLLGWNDWSSQKLQDHCELTTEKAFVVFSASGSFFVPLLVMLVVYIKIFMSARRRIRTNRGRSALVRITQQQEKEKRASKARLSKKSNISLNDSRKLIAEREKLIEACSNITNGDMSSENTKNSDEAGRPSKVSMQQRNSHPAVDPSALKAMLVDASGNGTMTTTNLNSAVPGEQITTTVLRKREKISVAKEKRAAKTIAVIIFVFTFCWLPFFCAYVILPFCESCYLHPKVHSAFVWLGYINSSLNPFLYGILNLEFRRAFRRILCPKHFMNRRRSTIIRH